MILADKIIRLRKKNGWSQEELAERMNVSRQAVSKWEGAQTVPDLDKILQLSNLFGVTTDYLLKDELESEEFTETDSDQTVKKITLEEANTYLAQRKRASWKLAIATFLCILSPIPLFLLGAASEIPSLGVSEALMGTVGLGALFLLVLCAIPIYIHCGFQNEPYAFLDQNVPFELEYGVKGLVTKQKAQFRNTYIRWNIIATCLCVISPVPLIVTAFAENELLSVWMLAVLMILAGAGACTFIVTEVQNASMQKLLKEGEYTARKKARSGLRETVGFAYWGILTAIYLVLSFYSAQYQITWLVFAVGGILFPVVMRICNCIADRRAHIFDTQN